MIPKNKIGKIKILLFYVTVFCFAAGLCGCESFSRKFTRKPKTDDKKAEEMVLVPEEYKAEAASSEELYRQYFLFWNSWQDELIDSLNSPNPNRKKHIDCISEAVKNLSAMKDLLKPDKQKFIDDYIKQMNSLAAALARDLYNSSTFANITKARQLKRKIEHDFSFVRIKDYLL
jgi:hypothetical protein